MSGIFYSGDVDRYISEAGGGDAYALLDEMLPKHRAKLKRLDNQLIRVLREVREVFPDATYYTGSGGFSLVLGRTHDGVKCRAQERRVAWGGLAEIGDGDW